jgi:hypothetical protein
MWLLARKFAAESTMILGIKRELLVHHTAPAAAAVTDDKPLTIEQV